MRKLLLLALLLFAVPGWAEVVPLDAAAFGADNALTMTYTVSAGTDRYLISWYLQDDDAVVETSATYGGVAGTLLRFCLTGDSNLGLTAFGWTDVQIASAANTTIAWEIDDTQNLIMTRSYEGVDQTNPVPETDCDHQTDSDPNPIATSSITAGDGSYVMSAAGHTAVGSYVWANITELLDEATGSSTLSIADVAVPSAGTINPQATKTGGTRHSIVSLEIAPAPGAVVTHYYAPPVVAGVWPDLFIIQALSYPDGEEEEAYTGPTPIPLNGQPPYVWSVVPLDALPVGLSIHADTGVISGTPGAATAGTYPFTLKATDAGGGIALRAAVIVIQLSGSDTLSFDETAEDNDDLVASPAWTTPGGCDDTCDGKIDGGCEVRKDSATECVLKDNIDAPEVYFRIATVRDGADSPATNRDQVLKATGAGGEFLFSMRIEPTTFRIYAKSDGQPGAPTGGIPRGFNVVNALAADEKACIEGHFATGTGGNAVFRIRNNGGALQEFSLGTATVNVDKISLLDANDHATQKFFFDNIKIQTDEFPGGCPLPDEPGGDPDPPPAAQPWMTLFSPARTHYVDDISCGGVGTIGDPECESTAFSESHYTAGDLHIFRAGNYHNTSSFLALDEDCTEEAPCVFKGYVDPATGQPERATTNGPIQMNGDWNWIVNMEVTDNHTSSNRNLIRQGNPGHGTRVINNVIRDGRHGDQNTIYNGSRQVSYGNTNYRPDCFVINDPNTPHGHNIYMTNDYNAFGWKYVVQNIIQENCQAGTKIMNIRGAGEPPRGVHVQDNLFAEHDNSVTVLNQNSSIPSFKIVLNRNYFSNLPESLGRSLDMRQGSSPTQAVVTNNYFAKASASIRGYWSPTPPEPNIFTGNEIYDPVNGDHFDELQTQGTSGAVGSHKISNSDVWDLNTYGGTFRLDALRCNNTVTANPTLAQWRTATDACRVTPASAVGFDINSTEVANPTVNKIVVLKNEYQCPSCAFNDQARGNIYIINWENATSDIVGISSVVGPGKTYTVRYARDFYGTAAASGTCPGSGACNVTLPIRKNSAGSTIFTGAYVITGEP